MARRGIICIETPWTADLRKPDSVRLLLQFFTSNNGYPLIYRQVGTVEGLRSLIHSIRAPRYRSFGLLYIGGHGASGVLKFGSRKVPLRDLATMLGSSWAGRHIVLACCSTLRSARACRHFMEATKVGSLVGYSKSPDWIEACALELLVMECLMWPWKPKDVKGWLEEKCVGLVEHYGFEVWCRNEGT
jgi:hypothetical protein